MAGPDQRVIDTKIPLTWLITSVVGIIFSIGGVFIRVDNMAATITKIDNKAEVRDERFNVVLQNVAVQTNRIETIQSQFIRLESSVQDTRREVDAIKEKQRWTPGK